MFISVMRILSVSRKICRNDSLAEAKVLISFKGVVVGLRNGINVSWVYIIRQIGIYRGSRIAILCLHSYASIYSFHPPTEIIPTKKCYFF